MPPVEIHNPNHPLARPLRVKYCKTFVDNLRGLMFHAPIAEDDGALLDQGHESKIDSAIHMFFVSFDLGIVWMDADRKVVDTLVAKSWRPFYMPAHKARFTLEIHPNRLREFTVGDVLQF